MMMQAPPPTPRRESRVRVTTDKRHKPDKVPPTALLSIACGGIVGALGRYLIELALPARTGGFPAGTFIINVTGSAILGFLLVTINERFAEHRLLRPLLGTGVLGAYTTFSTFTVEAVLLLKVHAFAMTLAYVALSVAVGLTAGFLGMIGARYWLRRIVGRPFEP
jgi:fluoride exporter